MIDISLTSLGYKGLEKLEAPFLEEEILGALSYLGSDKALGLYRFAMAFWLFSWEVVK